jgi:hypothetical protein
VAIEVTGITGKIALATAVGAALTLVLGVGDTTGTLATATLAGGRTLSARGAERGALRRYGRAPSQ